MTKAIVISILLILSQHLNAQIALEQQVGGSNFSGTTINLSSDLLLSDKIPFGIRAKIGIGTLVGYGHVGILHGGWHYFLKHWAMGVEMSLFSPPTTFDNTTNNFIDLLLYPNFT